MTRPERRDFATRCGTTLNYLAQLQYGCKRPGTQISLVLHEESGKKIPLSSLRPDVWGEQKNGSRRGPNRSQSLGRAGNA
jgi:hypothetical protein